MRRPLRRLLATAVSAAALAAGWALTAPVTAAATPAAAHAPASPAAPAPAPASLTAALAGLARERQVRAAALNTPRPYQITTGRGDTLSSIASATCGTARFWPALWWANRHQLGNPNVLPAHLTITVPPCHAPTPAEAAAALNAIPPPPPPPPALQAPAAAGPVAQSAPAPPGPAPAAATGSVAPSSAYEACVISSESGGNAGAVNASSGAGGLYQFLPSTWASLGYSGSPQDASPATQQQAFDRLYAQSGSAPWSSDGCG